MKPAKIAVICIAALAAIGLALVVRAMGSPSREPATASAAVEARPMTKVLVAARDLEAGRRLADADLSGAYLHGAHLGGWERDPDTDLARRESEER